MSKIGGGTLGEHTLPIPLSEDERIQKKDLMYQNMLHIAREDEVLALAKAKYKDETAMQKSLNERLLKELRNGFVEQKVRAFDEYNEETGIIEYIDEHGEEIFSRPATYEERLAYKEKINFRR